MYLTFLCVLLYVLRAWEATGGPHAGPTLCLSNRKSYVVLTKTFSSIPAFSMVRQLDYT